MSPVNFFEILEDSFSRAQARPNVIQTCIDRPTVGAAETVLYGINSLPQSRRSAPCVLVDGDTFYTADILSTYRNKLASINLDSPEHRRGGCVFVFDDDKPNESPYSYVKVIDGSGQRVVSIKEKDKSDASPLACSGCYCFHHTGTLLKEINETLEAYHAQRYAETMTHELYTSRVISSMIGKEGVFTALRLNAGDFTVLGTPGQLQDFITVNASRSDKKRFCFDLDNTLVTTPATPGDYTTCRPIQRVIDYARSLHEKGHHITIHTARRMRTHGGNVGSVVADIGAITLDQLKMFGIPHDEVLFGKPYADYYIDDKAVIPYVDQLHKETGFI